MQKRFPEHDPTVFVPDGSRVPISQAFDVTGVESQPGEVWDGLVAQDDSATAYRVVGSPARESFRLLLHDVRVVASGGVLLFFVVLALLGPVIYQHVGGTIQSDLSGPIGPQIYHTYDHQELSRQDETPSFVYWLGTDSVGRDILARLMQGMLISLVTAVMVEIVDVGMGLFVGLLAGYSWRVLPTSCLPFPR
jgi:ABC-type dipeptide/oligopeptide/nickel transport system permease subunit